MSTVPSVIGSTSSVVMSRLPRNLTRNLKAIGTDDQHVDQGGRDGQAQRDPDRIEDEGVCEERDVVRRDPPPPSVPGSGWKDRPMP